MADAENAMPASKKRAAGREITKDNPGLDDDENVSEQEMGTFKKASDEILATRRIVKVRRQTTGLAAPVSNPFAGIQLVPSKAVSDSPAAGSEKVVVKETEVGEKEIEDIAQNITEEEKGLEKKETKRLDANENNVAESDIPSEKEALEVKGGAGEGNRQEVNDVEEEESGGANKGEEIGKDEIADVKDQNKVEVNSSGGASNLTPFQQLSGSKNAFTGFTGTGFSAAAFSFNPISSDGAGSGADPAQSKAEKPLFGFGLSANSGSGSLFGVKDASLTKSETASGPSLQEVPTETGEENERAVFSANSALFEYSDGGWKERGRGEVKVNVSTLEGSKARLVMRTKGNLRLILNASLYPEMKLTYMDKKGVTFACINSNGEGKGALSTYALKFKDGLVADEFHAIVASHKGSPSVSAVLKTPENSPQ